MCYIYFDMVKSNVELQSARGAPAAGRMQPTRGREIGTASARSLLLTLLGEFVLPSAEPVWTSALVAGLGLLGVEEKTARQALARLAAEGWILPLRSGRRTSWRLTPAGNELLTSGAERIYGFGPSMHDWDGQWLVVLASAPEGSRQARHLLRTRLAWTGLGSLMPGVWVSPHPARQAEVRRALQDVGFAAGATFFVASLGELGDPRRIAGQAWDLAGLELRYKKFIEQVGRMAAATPRDTFAAQVRLVQEWRRFPFIDPGLPAELLPRPWSGSGAAEMFRAKHSQWESAAGQAWRDLAKRQVAGGT